VIIGARPSQGKTALAMNLASNMAVSNGKAVAVFSMEMSYEEIVERLVCSTANVSLQALRLTGFMKESDFLALPKRAEQVLQAPIWIDDSAGLTISAFKARARRAVVQFGVQAIIVDYLQLMKSPSRRAQDARWLEITEISAALKATAKELKVPVICCAQLNREAEGREFGKPKLSDLRESGSIEQDADIVALLWRPERHLENYGQREKLAKRLRLSWHDDEPLYGMEEMSKEARDDRDRQINEYAELIVAKQRNGPVGEIKLRFESDITKFQNVTTKTWSNDPGQRQK
jgi:replicative DNA helicase